MAATSSKADNVDGFAPEADYEDPLQEVDRAGPAFVPALAHVLTHLASLAPGRPNKVTHFHSVRAPQLSIEDYLGRIAKYFQCSNECFVLSLVYIDRIVKVHPEFTICNLNIHRLIVTSVMLAVKYFDDVYYSNDYYAKVGGIRRKEVNALEAQFLRLIDWRVYVSPTEYDQYRNHVFQAEQGNVDNVAAMRKESSANSTAAAAAAASESQAGVITNEELTSQHAINNSQFTGNPSPSDNAAKTYAAEDVCPPYAAAHPAVADFQ